MPKRKIISYDDDGDSVEEDCVNLNIKRSRYDDEFVKRIAAFNVTSTTQEVTDNSFVDCTTFASKNDDSSVEETPLESSNSPFPVSRTWKYPASETELDMPLFWSLSDGLGNVDSENVEEDTAKVMNAVSSISFVSTETKFGIELANLCNRANVPLHYYNKFAQLAKKYMCNHSMNPNLIPSREKLMKVLYEKIHVNPPRMVPVGSNDEYLSLFIFRDQLKDMLSSELFSEPGRLLINSDEDNPFGKYVPQEDEGLSDLPMASWYKKTHDKCIGPNLIYKDPNTGIEYKNWLVPLIFYTDKTGTGSSMEGTYSLEPFVFTLGILRMEFREQPGAWRHLGFIPPCNKPYVSSEYNLQFYHNCLSIMFEDIRMCQQEPLLCTLKIGSRVYHVRLVIEIAFVMGDQLSQDRLCGRRLVHSGAGRIHRGCFTSSMNAATTPPKDGCFRIPKQIFDQLYDIVIEWEDEDKRQEILDLCSKQVSNNHVSKITPKQLTSIIKLRSQIARDIMEKVFSLHTIKNAFHTLSFGCNDDGIHRATLDDPMHFNSSGLFFYLAQVSFHGLLPKDCENVENFMQEDGSKRSSVRYDLPRSSFRKGFSKVTMLTASEKVGIMHFLYCMLSTERVQTIFDKNILRQQKKYLGCQTEENMANEGTCKQSFPKLWDQHFFKKISIKDNRSVMMDRTLNDVRSSLTILDNLGFISILAPILLHFDSLHVEYLLQSVFEKRRSTSPSILKLVEQNVMNFPKHPELVQYTKMFYKRLKKPGPNQCHECDIPTTAQSFIKKHWFDKPKTTGVGETCAILTDVKGFRATLADALSFYGLVHEYHNLPSDIQTNFTLLDHQIKQILTRILSSFYRGDNSFDVLTCKCHSHFHLINDIMMYGPPMGYDAGKGERHLKTNAKEPSKTARKCGIKEFMDQTSKRVSDRIVLQRSLQFLPIVSNDLISGTIKKKTIGGIKPNLTDNIIWEYTRKKPHMEYDLNSTGATGVDGAEYKFPFKLLTDHIRQVLCLLHGKSGIISIWREIRLKLSNNEGNQYIRAFYEYDKYGPYFDWVHVTEKNDTYKPAKVLLLYQTDDKCDRAIVWCAASATTSNLNNETNISALWQMDIEINNGLPSLTSIPLSKIERCCMVHELWKNKNENQIPTTRYPKQSNRKNPYVIQECYPRLAWALNLTDKSRWE